MLARTFNWTPDQIDEIELGFYYSVCESFERFPPHYMLFPAYVGYEAPSSVKWKEFEKKLKEQEQEGGMLDGLLDIFSKASS